MAEIKEILALCLKEEVELSVADGELDIFFDEFPSDDLVALLKENKPALIQFLSEREALVEDSLKLRPIHVEQSSTDVNTLSYAQERIWFVEQLENGTGQFNMPSAFAYRGALSREAVAQSLRNIIARHEALRTVYTKDTFGNPKQDVLSDYAFALDYHDVSHLQEDAQQDAIDTLSLNNATHHFDLSGTEVLLKTDLIVTSSMSGLLLINLHHIAADGISIGLLLNEFKQHYRAIVNGTETTLADLPVQYRHYAKWQRDGLESGVLVKQLEYWREQLKDMPAVHNLPCDFERPKQPSYQGGVVTHTLSSSLVERLQQFASANQVSHFMVLHAVLSLLIAKCSREQDIVIGTPVSNRVRPEIESLIGLFVNTLVLRTQVDQQLNFNEFIEQIKQINVAAQTHQDVPFESLVESLNPERTSAHAPLFQILFSMNRIQGDSDIVDGLSIDAIDAQAGAAKYDLTLTANESESALSLSLEYSKDLFLEASIERFLRYFDSLLEQALTLPTASLQSLSLLSQAAQAQLEDKQSIISTQACEVTVSQLLTQSTQQHKDTLAVVCQYESLTYEQLDLRATQIAQLLHSQGVNKGDCIGIAMDRSSTTVAALLAVLKLGAAYVPLDKSLPSSRLSYIAADAHLKAVLCDTTTQATLNTLDTEVINLDDIKLSEVTTGISFDAPDPSDIAYIIYTSGSTGEPKGVKVSHGNVTSFISAMSVQLQTPEAGQGVWLALSAFAFDISVLEVFGALSAGFKVLVSPEQRLEGNKVEQAQLALNTLLECHRPTHMQCTPTLAKVFMSQGIFATHLSHLQVLLLGGEPMTEQLAAQLHDVSSAVVWNMYGPTEATVWATAARIVPNKAITIGQSLSHSQARVVDEHMNALPPGVIGELLLAGPCVAQGYLNKPQQSAKSFIASPFNSADKAYLTGDLVSLNEAGELRYHGRNDDQIKLRGFRIELSDIESHMESLAQVDGAIATVIGESAEEQKLVAFYTSTAEQVDEQAMRQALNAQLSDYMVPFAFIKLDSLPLTVSGKKNRKALPKAIDLNAGRELIAPECEQGQELAQIWCDLLKVERVGLNSNFFELGGHSLLLTRLQVVIKEQFDVSVSIKDIFERPTLAEQVSLLDSFEKEVW